ncbi:tetratricopeptide repeat protein [Aestuariivirga litoralis]|uniref:tetratricopeptide repeat protein n=1 Tax=Aestuariivirga litoralis TaxID=2650924 RepID=UPI0011B61CDD|nr:sel1 repeat family protein [Aestuariivirga litoralis]
MARYSMSCVLLGGLLAGTLGGMAHATETAAPAPTAAQQAAPAPAPATPAAPAQSPWDLLKAGQALASGEGVAKDTAKARAIFEQLMEQDNKQLAAAAAYNLAKLAAGDLKDPDLSTRALERGIALDDPWAMIMRAQALAKGTAKDQAKAAELYLRAKEVGQKNPDVQKAADYALGQLYLTPGLLSAKKALAYHQSAADLGNAWSLMAIGGIYEKGTGTKANWTKSRDAYLKAYDSGVAEVKGAAALALARLYSQPGHSAPKRAVEYLLVGQQSGNVWATMMLADRYLKGLGVKKSTATARRLYTELKAGSDPGASGAAAFQLGRLYSTVKPRNLKLAEENFKFGAARGDVWSSFFLAQLYINDMRSKANRRKARELLQGVAKSDDPQARKAATALLKKVR